MRKFKTGDLVAEVAFPDYRYVIKTAYEDGYYIIRENNQISSYHIFREDAEYFEKQCRLLTKLERALC